MEENQVKLGKIKVYGKVIDLDNTPVEELEKMGEILEKRLVELGNRYIDLCEERDKINNSNIEV